MTTLLEPVDAAPFVAWLERQIAHITADETLWRTTSGGSALPPDATKILGERLGVHEDWLRKGAWTRSGQLERATVEDALDRAGVAWFDVFPDDAPDEIEPDGFCGRCHEVVTPISGACPWCESPVAGAEGRERRHCATCARMVHPRDDGTCWRCGSATAAGAPYAPCACGCGTERPQFDPQGRPAKYVRGHAPRSLERQTGVVEVEPFAAYLEERLRNLDVLQALAREHGISRDDVVAVLERREPTVKRALVQRALWIFARAGKGMPNRPDARSLFDLYPDDVRSKVCPGCGEGKARHADLCKACSRKAKTRERRRASAQKEGPAS